MSKWGEGYYRAAVLEDGKYPYSHVIYYVYSKKIETRFFETILGGDVKEHYVANKIGLITMVVFALRKVENKIYDSEGIEYWEGFLMGLSDSKNFNNEEVDFTKKLAIRTLVKDGINAVKAVKNSISELYEKNVPLEYEYEDALVLFKRAEKILKEMESNIL